MKLYSITLKTGKNSQVTYEPIQAPNFKRALWIAREFNFPQATVLLDWYEMTAWHGESEAIITAPPLYIA
tara:strand:+ start:384 stop:593 length:210 start_codon:yes stop_codon:yes gene_type:complete